MSLRPTDRARRIAEPGLLAAIAAVLHLADLLMAMGMLGSIFCPLPHALSVKRHGLRAGALGAMSAVFALGILGTPVEGAYHLFLFVMPGLAAGWALRSEAPLGRVVAAGSLACALGVAGTYLVLERATGMPDSLEKMGSTAVWAADWTAAPFRWASGDEPRLDLVPGLASPAAHQAQVEALLAFPAGIFLALGTLVFLTSWMVAALMVARLGEPGRAPPVPLGARLPRGLALLYLASFWAPPGESRGVQVLRANLNLMLAGVTYLAGYLSLLAGARGRPGGALLALVAAMPFYYLSIWAGLLSSLRAPADAESGGISPRTPGSPGR